MEEIRIEPDFMRRASSLDSCSDGVDNLPVNFDTHKIVDNGRGVYWLEEVNEVEGLTSFMLPGCIEDDSDEIKWSDSFNNTEETEVEKPFNLLPNGKRKKSVRTKVKNMFRKSYCRRAAYAIDSKSTSLGDGLAVSFGKLKMFMKNSIERLRRSEPSWRRGPWTNFEDVFSGGNNFIPFMNITPATGW